MSIVGKFFFHCGEEYQQTGHVISLITPELLLIEIDKCGTMPGGGMVVIPIFSVVSAMEDDGFPRIEWEFFDSREALAAFTDWLETPPDDKDDKRPPSPQLN